MLGACIYKSWHRSRLTFSIRFIHITSDFSILLVHDNTHSYHSLTHIRINSLKQLHQNTEAAKREDKKLQTEEKKEAEKMGNDGGSIPTRRELVKSAARNPTTTELKATQTESQQYHWSHDPLTRAVLQSPVVSDSQGRLYNKASILEFLLPAEGGGGGEGLNKVEAEKVMQGSVRSLRDVVEVRFEVEAEAKGGGAEKWRCPVTGTALGPGSKGVYLVPCGHAYSGAAIKAVSGGGGEGGNNKCLVCEEGYADGDVVPILSINEEEIERLRLRVKALKERGQILSRPD